LSRTGDVCARRVPEYGPHKELMEPDMKRPKPSLPVQQHDYELALQTAVSWLGDRYLLAEPVSRRVEQRKPFFFEPRHWYQARRTLGPGSRKH
jgi:hypothetical protein